MIYKDIKELIGNTPILELSKIESFFNLTSKIYAKLEAYNPGGSIKDRIALNMIEKELKKGTINYKTTIIEPTSGNTGIGLALVCATYNLPFIAIMPSSMSIERQKLIKAYGGKVVLTDPSLGMKGSVDKAIELSKEIKNSFIPSQFTNKNNPLMHYKTTAKEIILQVKKIDYFVAGIGTGGTISGVGKYLKEHSPNTQIIGVEPFSSPLLTKGISGKHKIQGIGANFVPQTLNKNIIDKIIPVKDEDAYKYSKMTGTKEGFLVGISSGAILSAALSLAKKENKKNFVIIFPDSGERYLSTDLY